MADNFVDMILLILAYLLGSIPFGLLLTRWFSTADVRSQGSGNIGATNVARVAGPGLGIGTLMADMLKGLLPVLLVFAVKRGADSADELLLACVALAPVIGHMFPIYSGFKGGGKGVATTAGAFLGISAWAVLIALTVFGLIAGLTRRVSAASLSAALVLPPALWLTTGSTIFLLSGFPAAALIIVRHRDNIRRLMAGTEPEFKTKPDKH